MQKKRLIPCEKLITQHDQLLPDDTNFIISVHLNVCNLNVWNMFNFVQHGLTDTLLRWFFTTLNVACDMRISLCVVKSFVRVFWITPFVCKLKAYMNVKYPKLHSFSVLYVWDSGQSACCVDETFIHFKMLQIPSCTRSVTSLSLSLPLYLAHLDRGQCVQYWVLLHFNFNILFRHRCQRECNKHIYILKWKLCRSW